jgi:hypothetical protein
VIGVVVCRNSPQLKQTIDAFKIQYKSPTTNVVTTNLTRRGHPGYIVKCLETGEMFASQRRAAEALGVNRYELYKQLQDIVPTAGGYTFKKMGEAI